MGRFLNGALVGLGIGLLVAPMKGEETRRLVRTRYEELRSSLSENEQLKQAGQQTATRVSQTAGTLKNAAQQAATKVRGTGSTLGNLAQQSARKVKQRGQDVASTTKQTTISVKQGRQTGAAIPDEGVRDIISPVDTIVPVEGSIDLTSEY